MDIEGVAKLGHWSPLPDGYFALVEPTSKPRHVHIHVTDKPKSRTVRHRKHRKRIDNLGKEEQT